MKKLDYALAWEARNELLEVGSTGDTPDIVTLAVTCNMDGRGYVLSQKKDLGWPVQAGAFTLFGGAVDDIDKGSADAAISREAVEELGDEFTAQLTMKAACDVISSVKKGADSKLYRMYTAHLGDISYPEWTKLQGTITAFEGVGFVLWSEAELRRNPGLFVAHDRDMMGYALQLAQQ